MLTVEPGQYVQLRSTSARTIEYFERLRLGHGPGQGPDRGLDALAASLLDGIAETLSKYADVSSRESGRSEVLEYLREMEKRVAESLRGNAREVAESLRVDVREVAGRVSDIDMRVQGQLAGLIGAVEVTLKASVERLDADRLSERIAERTRSDVFADFSALLREELREAVQGPVRAVERSLESLPKELAELSSTSRAPLAELAREVERLAERSGRASEVLTERLQELATSARVAEGTRAGDVRAAVQDSIAELKEGTYLIRTAVSGIQNEILSIQREVADGRAGDAVLRKIADDISARIETLKDTLTVERTRLHCSQKLKGQQGEAKLFDLLSDRLTTRDGYEVELVNGKDHACDILIKRLGFCDVRVENKAHGLLTGEKVRAKEVARFCSDLLGLQSHGIFVSQHSGIVGKGDCEVELLANNRVAVFLSNCEYNVDSIYDMLLLIYKLDDIVRRSTEGGGANADSIRITPETLKRVSTYVKDFTTKVATAKTHLRESLTLLSELTLDAIERCLMSSCSPSSPFSIIQETEQTQATQNSPISQKFACTECACGFSSRQGLAMHVRKKHGDVASVSSR